MCCLTGSWRLAAEVCAFAHSHQPQPLQIRTKPLRQDSAMGAWTEAMLSPSVRVKLCSAPRDSVQITCDSTLMMLHNDSHPRCVSAVDASAAAIKFCAGGKA